MATENKLVSLGFPDMFSVPFSAPIQVGSKLLLEKLIQLYKKKNDWFLKKFHKKDFVMKNPKMLFLRDSI